MSSPCEAVNMGRHGLPMGCPVIPGAWDSLEETQSRRASSGWPQFKGSGDPTLFYKEQGYRNLIKGTVGTWVSSLENTGLVLCGLRLIAQVWLPFLLVLLHSSSIRFFKFQEETVTVELVRAKFPVLGTPMDLTDRSSTGGKILLILHRYNSTLNCATTFTNWQTWPSCSNYSELCCFGGVVPSIRLHGEAAALSMVPPRPLDWKKHAPIVTIMDTANRKNFTKWIKLIKYFSFPESSLHGDT